MPFSAHFYVLLTLFTSSLYFAVSLITNMLFSIHLILVFTNLTWRNHLLWLKELWGLGRGCCPSPRKEKCDELFH